MVVYCKWKVVNGRLVCCSPYCGFQHPLSAEWVTNNAFQKRPHHPCGFQPDQRPRLSPPPTRRSEQQTGNVSTGPRVVAGHDDRHTLSYPAENRSYRRAGRYLRSPLALLQVGPACLHNDAPTRVGQQPLDLTIESLAVLANAPQKVAEGLPLDCNNALQALDGVVASWKRTGHGLQW